VTVTKAPGPIRSEFVGAQLPPAVSSPFDQERARNRLLFQPGTDLELVELRGDAAGKRVHWLAHMPARFRREQLVPMQGAELLVEGMKPVQLKGSASMTVRQELQLRVQHHMQLGVEDSWIPALVLLVGGRLAVRNWDVAKFLPTVADTLERAAAMDWPHPAAVELLHQRKPSADDRKLLLELAAACRQGPPEAPDQGLPVLMLAADKPQWTVPPVSADGKPVEMSAGLFYLGPWQPEEARPAATTEPGEDTTAPQAGPLVRQAKAQVQRLASQELMPNNPVTGAGMRALLAAGPDWAEHGVWEEVGDAMRARHQTKRGHVDVGFLPKEWVEAGEFPPDALRVQQRFIEDCNLDTIDALLTCLALTNSSTEPDGAVLVTVDTILAQRNPRRGSREDRGQLERRVQRAMEQLRALSYSTSQPHRVKRGRRYVEDVLEITGDRLLDVVTATQRGQAELFPGEQPEMAQAWRVRLGQWAGAYMQAKPGRRWLSTMPAKALALSCRLDRTADKLAKKVFYRHFLLPGSIQHMNQPLDFTIEGLLQDIFELPPPGKRHSKWGARTRDALERALQTMLGEGMLGAVDWLDGQLLEVERPTGWVKRWLQSRVRLTGLGLLEKQQGGKDAATPLLVAGPAEATQLPAPAKRVRNHTPAKRRRRAKEPLAKVPMLDAVAVRHKLEALHWQQGTLARRLGVDGSTLSLALNHKRTPSQKLADAVQKWLDTPNQELGGLPE